MGGRGGVWSFSKKSARYRPRKCEKGTKQARTGGWDWGKSYAQQAGSVVRKTNEARQHQMMVDVIEEPYTWALGKLTISEEDLRS